MNFVTVFKSGHTVDDVVALACQVKNNTKDREFVCYTNTPIKKPFVKEVKFENMLDVFKHKGPTVFLDLNLLVTGDIDRLAEIASDCTEDEIYVCSPWNKKMKDLGYWAIKIMIFNGDWRWIPGQYKGGDLQEYISQMIEPYYINVLQDNFPGIYSYAHLQGREKPDDAKIIVFNNRPKVSECKPAWIKEIYNTPEPIEEEEEHE